MVIPDSVTSIGNYAFAECFGLTGSLMLPDSIAYIGKFAFAYSYGLSGNLKISNSITMLDSYTFAYTDFETVTIPASVEQICGLAFEECRSLNKITFLGGAPRFGDDENGEDVFANVTATVYYPADDPTWTDDVMQDYSGSITWIAE